MHIVHELIDGPDKANYKEQLAVIGILFKIEEESHPFVERLRCEDFGNIENIHFAELFGDLKMKPHTKEYCTNAHCFYHYKGSLTTPPCTDVVNWFVYKDVLPIK